MNFYFNLQIFLRTNEKLLWISQHLIYFSNSSEHYYIVSASGTIGMSNMLVQNIVKY